MLKLHHLRIGRSVFTAWLMEELGVEYELQLYIRNEAGRAPPELKQAHPLGKSPVIEVDGTIIAESIAIATYLLESYDQENRLGPTSDTALARADWMHWLVYSEASAFAPLLMKLIMLRSGDKPAAFDAFASAEVALHLGHLDQRLSQHDYILGAHFTAPDIGITYIAQMALRLGEIDAYPSLKAYMERNLSRPAFQRAMERTGG